MDDDLRRLTGSTVASLATLESELRALATGDDPKWRVHLEKADNCAWMADELRALLDPQPRAEHHLAGPHRPSVDFLTAGIVHYGVATPRTVCGFPSCGCTGALDGECSPVASESGPGLLTSSESQAIIIDSILMGGVGEVCPRCGLDDGQFVIGECLSQIDGDCPMRVRGP